LRRLHIYIFERKNSTIYLVNWNKPIIFAHAKMMVP